MDLINYNKFKYTTGIIKRMFEKINKIEEISSNLFVHDYKIEKLDFTFIGANAVNPI